MNLTNKINLLSATRPDGISCNMFENAKEPNSAVVALMSQLLKSSCIPNQWKLGKIVETFKSFYVSSPYQLNINYMHTIKNIRTLFFDNQ